jgi:hypothetical protein
MKDLRSILLEHHGEFSLYVGKALCLFKPNKIYDDDLDAVMEKLDYSFEAEKGGMTDALGFTIQDVLKTLLKFDSEDCIFDWGGIIMQTHNMAMSLYHKMVDFIESNSEKITQSAEQYTDSDNGFWLRTKDDTDYLYIQEGAFNRLFGDFAESKLFIFDFWENVKRISAPKRGNIKTQPYLKRVPVGRKKDGNKQQRKWFYEFCFTDLENEYPSKMTAFSTIATKATELFERINTRIVDKPEDVSNSAQEYEHKQLGFWIEKDNKHYLSIPKEQFIGLCNGLPNSESITNIAEKILAFWVDTKKFNISQDVSVQVGKKKLKENFYEFCWAEIEAAYITKFPSKNEKENTAQ